MTRKTRVYLAGPLFNAAEKDYNLKITDVLEMHGYEVFLPQRDGFEAAALNGSQVQIVRQIFAKDTAEVDNADVVVIVLDGRVPDDGACVELGYAFAKGKRCYGIKTDTRALQTGLELNPLIAGCLRGLLRVGPNEDACEVLDVYLQVNNL